MVKKDWGHYLLSCLSLHVKETKISGVDESKYAFEMISYFLNHAMVLEKLILRMINLLEKDELCILKKTIEVTNEFKEMWSCRTLVFLMLWLELFNISIGLVLCSTFEKLNAIWCYG